MGRCGCEPTPIRYQKSAVFIVFAFRRKRSTATFLSIAMVNSSLNPWYVTGLIEGEGCFCISISTHKSTRVGFEARLMFEVEMIIDDQPLLKKLQQTMGCGHLYVLNYERYGWRPHVKFAVKSHKDINTKVIPFFTKYPLVGKKRKDFKLFCEANELFNNKEHLTLKGIMKLRRIQGKMNQRKTLK